MVNGSLSLDSNSMESFNLNTLTRIGNSLSIDKNSKLTQFNFSSLGYIGGALNIVQNDQLTDFSFFPNLTTIGGSVNLVGGFNNGSFPSLSKVAGGFNLTSTGQLSCAAFVKLNGNGAIKGDKFYCQGASSTVSSSSSKAGNANGGSTDTAVASSSGGASSTTRSSEGSALAKAGLFSFAALFAGVGAFLY
ncbi:hypothetical protein PUMCH_002421 [Australozyma saopauloensis]|uniref:Receptor L-domain domain-containing protein n=1 Tax=Australozyma saopauloensis TaxID=291208 RepID=A0AAX4H978_9ASCO|nr:hypothetical protein PUMCH_002421 [[Candida] saopauloensis]